MLQAPREHARDILDVNEIALEVAFKDHDRAIGHRPVHKIVYQQVNPHACRQAEHGRQSERKPVFTREDRLLRRHFRRAVEGDRPQRRFLGAELAFLTNTVAAVGHRHEHPLIPGGKPTNALDRLLIDGAGADRILLAHGSAHQRSEWDDRIGLANERLEQRFVPAVAAHDVEALVAAAVQQR